MLSRRNIVVAIVVTCILGTLAALASGGGNSPEAGQEATPTSTPDEIEGDPREKNSGPIRVPAAGKLAGSPVATARRFVDEWLNRTASEAELRRQRPILVGLSTGPFAQLVQVTIDDALATGEFGPENEGDVLICERANGEEGIAVLIVTRERQVREGEPLEPYRYATYIARLEPAGGAYAVSSLEPQS